MSEPLVCAIMLTKDRPEMAARAVRAFREQTYPNKDLIVWCTGEQEPLNWYGGPTPSPRCPVPLIYKENRGLSIGALRNEAIGWADDYDIIIHFDDDDVSHPNRIAEQVAHLQSSGADVVGYNELLFWRTHQRFTHGNPSGGTSTVNLEHEGEAWIWKNNTGAAGSSFCYWRNTWERKPFPDLPHPDRGGGEDFQWAQGLNVACVSCFPREENRGEHFEPRLICSIHGGNVTPYSEIIEKSNNWRRAPGWDECARSKMCLP